MDGVNDIPDSFKSANRLNICGVLDNQNGLYESEKILFQRSTKSYDYVKEMYEWINLVIFGDNKALSKLDSIFESMKNAGFL
ncbi:MAG: hypothetical protein PF505_15220 [Vallitaleaceae bacterium]|jgi:hypothetical protein|nr:hypothetical protein [Vallitaleaceae bacterium]